MSWRLEALLTAAATAVAIAFFVSVPHWPAEWTTRPTLNADAPAALGVPSVLLGPSVLAGLKPVPDVNLNLPADMAVVAIRRGINGETGLIPTAASVTTFRLLASGDLVSVASVPGADPVRASATTPDGPLRVRGQYAVASVDRGVTHVRWTENGVTFDITSRTLDASRLTEVANRLR
jgi:hypothetical protein